MRKAASIRSRACSVGIDQAERLRVLGSESCGCPKDSHPAREAHALPYGAENLVGDGAGVRGEVVRGDSVAALLANAG